MAEETPARPWFSTPTGLGWLRFGRLIIVLLLAVFAIRTVVISWTSSDDPRRTVNDFTVDFVSARALLAGGRPYADTAELARRYLTDPNGTNLPVGNRRARNPHPPAYILLITPLASLPYTAARNVWLIVMALSIAAAMAIVARQTGGSMGMAALVALCSLALPPVFLELRIGEVNAFILLAVTVGWLEIRKGRQVWGGMALGLASALKLYPLFLLIPLLRRRRLKAALTQLVTTGLITFGTGFMFGWTTVLRVVTQVIPANTRYWLAAPQNLSLFAIPFRWLTNTRWSEAVVDTPILALGIAFGLGLFCLVAAGRTRAHLSQDDYWAAVPWMLLATPLYWYQYTVLALPLIYIVLKNQLDRSSVAKWSVAIAVGLVLVRTTELLSTGRHEPTIALLGVFALPTYGLILLGLLEWGSSARRRRAEDHSLVGEIA